MMSFKKICLVTLCLCVQSSLAANQFGSVLVSKVLSVYDGDTFRVDIDSLSPIVGKNIAIRLEGVDTPEIKGKCQYENDLAILARDFVREKLFNAKEIKLNESCSGNLRSKSEQEESLRPEQQHARHVFFEWAVEEI